MEIPSQKTVQLCQAERFAQGLKMILEECGAVSYDYNSRIGITNIQFNDGSSIGMRRAFVEAGILK